MPEPTLHDSKPGKLPQPRRWRWRVLLAAVLAVGVVSGALYIHGTQVPSPQEPASSLVEAEAPTDPDDWFRRMVVGVWEDDHQGKRTMTLAEDGTGTMVVELSGWKAALSASRLRFDMVWSVEDGRLKKQTVGGEPEAQVQMILSTMGDRVDEPILELTEDRLVLLDQDGKTKYEWRQTQK
ncbi:MAG: hypothetical protein ABIP48_17980 [Planctomycetota bacterium]